MLSDASAETDVPSLKDLSAEAASTCSKADVKSVLILDARSYAAAVGNRARGGGVECAEYYPNTEILFMNLANIHSIRKSFQVRLFFSPKVCETASRLRKNSLWFGLSKPRNTLCASS